MSCWNQEQYIKAWNFACAAHQGQLVPGAKLAYVNHVGLVAMEVMAAIAAGEQVANPDVLVGCALLHDTIEDTPVTFEGIALEFGAEIASGVLALSKNKELPGKEAQMRDSLARIQQQPSEVWMVKLADRITNLQPPPGDWDMEKIRQYRDEAVLIVETLGKASPYLAQRLHSKIDQYSM
ncbi:MAG: HD domain-containing protein [Desulfobulbus sp.]|nr:HD domain-containing protein [Desulfobulbus sp.]